MIKKDLLGISVNELIDNYMLLFDKDKGEVIGVVKKEHVDKIDAKYGTVYEERFWFVDVCQGGIDVIQQGEILTYYEILEFLDDFIGWKPDQKIVEEVSNCLHDIWIDWSKETTQHVINVLKIIKSHQVPLITEETEVIVDVQNAIDIWRVTWGPYFLVDCDKEKYNEQAKGILETLHDLDVIE